MKPRGVAEVVAVLVVAVLIGTAAAWFVVWLKDPVLRAGNCTELAAAADAAAADAPVTLDDVNRINARAFDMAGAAVARGALLEARICNEAAIENVRRLLEDTPAIDAP